MTPAGDRPHRITLQAKSVTRDALGGEIITWQDQDTIWAKVKALTGRALFAAQQAQSEVTASITLHHRSDITEAWRVLHGADVYSIDSIIPDGRRAFITLQCSKGLKNG